MRKLSLNLDDLQVDTFDTAIRSKGKGTVIGEQQCTCWTYCGQNTCPGCPTCDASCNGTCHASCNGTCDASCNGSCICQTDGTCGYSCYDTECGCVLPTCQASNCGMEACCAVQGY